MTKRFTWNSKDVVIDDNATGNQLEVIDITEIEVLLDLLNGLYDENEQLRHDATILIQANTDYRKENEQLKQRNDNQAEQLDRLYGLIEAKDWRSLYDIITDFKRTDEQLKREWGTYGDVE